MKNTMKTEKGDWASIPFKVPAEGENCAQVAADGKSYAWTTFNEPTVTLSLDKTEADAGSEVTVTLTATADNIAGEDNYVDFAHLGYDAVKSLDFLGLM